MSKIRLHSLIAAILLVLVLVACGSQPIDGPAGDEATAPPAVQPGDEAGAPTATTGDASGDEATDTPAGQGGDAAAGQGIFAQRCASCHGQAGAGGRSFALAPARDSLKSSSEADFIENMTNIITHGKGRMPAWGDTGRLNAEQISNVVAYILSLNE